MSSNRTLGFATLVGTGMLCVALVVLITTPPAEQYEMSLYAAFPTYLWGLLVGAFFIGEMVILLSAQQRESTIWKPALGLVLLTNATLLLLPYVRGYTMYGRGDALTHIGYARDITLFESITGGNIYPVTHVLLQTVAYATDTEPMQYAVLTPIIFAGVYFGAIYYLLIHLFNTRQEVLFRLPFAMLPVLGTAYVGVRPFDLSILLTPLVLYLFIKGQQQPTLAVRGSFVVVAASYILYHPLSGLFLMLVFGVWTVARHAPKIDGDFTTPTNVFSLVFVCFVAWYQSYRSILFRIETVFGTLFGQAGGAAPVQQYSETVERASPPLIDLFRVWLFTLGTEFVIFALGFGFLCLLAVSLYRNWYSVDSYVLLFGCMLVAFSFGGLAFLLVDLTVGMDRPFQFAKIGGVILAGGVFYLLWQYIDSQSDVSSAALGFNVTVGAVLLVLVLLVTFSLYPSPLGSGKNYQVTEMELEGSEWLAENGQSVSRTQTLGINYRRFHDALYGKESVSIADEGQPPPHFDYTSRARLGQSYQDDTYMIITRLGRITYPRKFPDYRPLWRFKPRDFDRLNRDRTVSQVYDNGGFDLYRVDGTAASNETDADR